MTKTTKRIFAGIGLLLVAAVATIGITIYSIFSVYAPIQPGDTNTTVRTVKDGFVSAFVLDAGNGKVALIDAGKDSSGAAILADLSSRKLDASAVSAIFLTHEHGDHTAAVRLFPAAEVYAMQAEVAGIGHRPQDPAKLIVTHPLSDGEIVNVGTLAVQAFAVPGHTQGSAVYLASGVLFFGDSASADKNGRLIPAVKLFSKDQALNIASLKSLAARLSPRADQIRTLAFAHSGPLGGLGPLTTFANAN